MNVEWKLQCDDCGGKPTVYIITMLRGLFLCDKCRAERAEQDKLMKSDTMHETVEV